MADKLDEILQTLVDVVATQIDEGYAYDGEATNQAKSEILKHYELKPDETKPSKVTIKGGEWYRETSKPKLEDRPLPAPDDTHGDCFTRQEVEEALKSCTRKHIKGNYHCQCFLDVRKRLGI